MSRASNKLLLTLTALGVVGATLVYAPVGQAFNFGDMMNPGRWMGGGSDRYDDDWNDYGPGSYGGGPYGPGGFGGGPYGAPYGPGPAPYYGGYGAPGYAAPAPAAPAPAAAKSSSENTKSAEIEALKRRIDELEAKQGAVSAPPPSTWGTTTTPSTDWGSQSEPSSSSDWGSAPAFRPLGKY